MRTFNKTDEAFIKMLSSCKEIRGLLDALQDEKFYSHEWGALDRVFKEKREFDQEKAKVIEEYVLAKEWCEQHVPLDVYLRRFETAKRELSRVEDITPRITKIANQRTTLLEALDRYFQLLYRYMLDEIPSIFIVNNGANTPLKFKDLATKSELEELFAAYVTPAFQEKILYKIICGKDEINRITSPQVVMAILQYQLWEAFDMPNKVIEPLAASLALLTTVSDGEISYVEKLLAHGARSGDVVNAERQTTLHLAMKHPKKLLELLLQHDDTLDFDSVDAKNMTALQVGGACGNVEAIRVLQAHLDKYPAEEIERKALRAMYFLLLKQKKGMAENARLVMKSLRVSEELETTVQALSEECKAQKNALLMQEETLILEREKMLLGACETQFAAMLCELSAMFMEAKTELQRKQIEFERAQAQFEEERTRPERESAALKQREIARKEALQKEREAEYATERQAAHGRLVAQLVRLTEELQTNKDKWFCNAQEAVQIDVELELIKQMTSLLNDVNKSNSDKHVILSSVLETEKYKKLKNPSATFCLVERVLTFFSYIPWYKAMEMPTRSSVYQQITQESSVCHPKPPAKGLAAHSRLRLFAGVNAAANEGEVSENDDTDTAPLIGRRARFTP